MLTQTRRHSHLVHLLGIRHVVLAVNKMDLVDYDRDRFDAIVADYRAFADEIGIGAFTAIPIAALAGDNIAAPQPGHALVRRPGPARASRDGADRRRPARRPAPFHMAVQWVNRPDSRLPRLCRPDRRRHASGPATRSSSCPRAGARTVERIVTFDGDLDRAVDGQSVTLTLADEVDCSRGEVIAAASAPPEVADGLDANLVWMADEPLAPGRSYWLKIGASTVSATVSSGRAYRRRRHRPAGRRAACSALNDIGRCEIEARPRGRRDPLCARAASSARFILIDKLSHATAAAGMIDGFPRRVGARPRRPARRTGSSG